MRAHDVLGAAPFDESSADFVVRLAHRVAHLHERNAVARELLRIDRDLVLPHEAAHTRHLGDAGYRLQLVAEMPVLERTEIGERVLASRIDERVLKDPTNS